MTGRQRGPATTALHGATDRGAAPDRTRPARAHVPPVEQTTAFTFPDFETGRAAFRGSGDYIYTRMGNPTVRELERRIAALETLPGSAARGAAGGDAPELTPGTAAGGSGTAGGGSDTAAAATHASRVRDPEAPVDCCVFGSGMAALAGVALGLGGDGARIVAQEGIYGTSEHMLAEVRRFGMRVDFVPVGDLEALRSAVRRDPAPSLVHVETPANPLLQLTDVRAAADIAHEAGALLSVDATFATPVLLRPLRWGADFAVHSTTKFISGHGVAVGGAVSAEAALLERVLRPVRRTFGGSADPFAAWLTLLGLRTLPLRMERHCANAEALVGFLRARDEATGVHFPDPAALPPGQLARGGPMVSFELRDGEVAVGRMLDRLRVVTIAATLGTLDTVVQHPYSMSHAVLPVERRRELGIGPGLVRVSVGLEDAEDLIEDFRQALETR